MPVWVWVLGVPLGLVLMYVFARAWGRGVADGRASSIRNTVDRLRRPNNGKR